MVLITAALLAGCSLIPTQRKFPNAPPELMKNCEQLLELESGKTAVTDLLKVVVHNYTLYYECSNRVDGWKQWHKDQKEIFEAVK